MTNPGEKAVLESLAQAWDSFVELGEQHPDDLAEFRHAIHAAQCLIAWRVARRADPLTWSKGPLPSADREAEDAGPESGAGEVGPNQRMALYLVAIMIRDSVNRYRESGMQCDADELDRLTGLFNLPPEQLIERAERELEASKSYVR